MKDTTCLLVTPAALKRGWIGRILSNTIARTGLETAWAGIFDASPAVQPAEGLAAAGALPANGTWGVFVLQGEEAPGKLAAAAGSPEEPGSLAALFSTPADAAFAVPRAREAVSPLLSRLIAAQEATADPLGKPAVGGEERSLVLIKPDNFHHPGIRPGEILDVFARTGLPLVAMKVHHMSVAEGMDFYGPVLEALVGRFTSVSGPEARGLLEKGLGLPLPAGLETGLGDLLGPVVGRHHWENIVEFMTGHRPSTLPADRHAEPGSRKILALVFEGRGAVAKIRTVLGPTDPAKAPPGTIRKEFGTSIMVNAGHASDSPENAAREIGIVKVADNRLKRFVESCAVAA